MIHSFLKKNSVISWSILTLWVLRAIQVDSTYLSRTYERRHKSTQSFRIVIIIARLRRPNHMQYAWTKQAAIYILCTHMYACVSDLYYSRPAYLDNLKWVQPDVYMSILVVTWVQYCRALTKRSISQNFQNYFFCIIHISLSFSILCQKILAENHWQSSFLGSIKTLYPIFRVGFDNQNTLSSARVYNTYNLADNLYFYI